ncbi:MAG: helix-turn-helix transcriptional regulator [Clostridia bacterium]|nr:helix-turn-helix transcriptional regulator [Clostridia bacterium]
MVFAEKLKLIMQLTATTNSRLAAAINVDPSLISRLKSGDRFISAKSDYLSLMAEYFGSKCNDSFKTLTVIELLGAEFGEDIVEALKKWFLDESIGPDCGDASVICSLTGESNKKNRKNGKYIYFRGDKAISEAVEFITELIEQKGKIKKIKMLSNCIDSPDRTDLLECCSEVLLELAQQGTEIMRVVPNFTDLGSAIKDVFSWLPILKEGKLKSYNYQDFKEGVFNNLILVVPGVAALFSDSVGTSSVIPTMVTTDAKAVSDFESLFDEYISFCTEGVRSEPNLLLNEALTDFFERKEDCCNIYASLPFEWTPEEFLSDEKEKAYLRQIASSVKELLKTNTVTEIFPLMSPNEIRNEEVAFLCGAEKQRAYNAEQYLLHLSEIVRLLETQPNYYAFPMQFNEDIRENILIKRSFGAIVLPETDSATFGIIEHPSSVSALWQYFMNDARLKSFYGKKQAIDEIKAFADKLKN